MPKQQFLKGPYFPGQDCQKGALAYLKWRLCEERKEALVQTLIPLGEQLWKWISRFLW